MPKISDLTVTEESPRLITREFYPPALRMNEDPPLIHITRRKGKGLTGRHGATSTYSITECNRTLKWPRTVKSQIKNIPKIEGRFCKRCGSILDFKMAALGYAKTATAERNKRELAQAEEAANQTWNRLAWKLDEEIYRFAERLRRIFPDYPLEITIYEFMDSQ